MYKHIMSICHGSYCSYVKPCMGFYRGNLWEVGYRTMQSQPEDSRQSSKAYWWWETRQTLVKPYLVTNVNQCAVFIKGTCSASYLLKKTMANLELSWSDRTQVVLTRLIHESACIHQRRAIRALFRYCAALQANLDAIRTTSELSVHLTDQIHHFYDHLEATNLSTQAAHLSCYKRWLTLLDADCEDCDDDATLFVQTAGIPRGEVHEEVPPIHQDDAISTPSHRVGQCSNRTPWYEPSALIAPELWPVSALREAFDYLHTIKVLIDLER